MARVQISPPMKGVMKGLPSHEISANYSEHMNNVRPLDNLESKIRVGQRPALDKWGAGTQIGAAENPVVAMCSVTTVE